MLSVHFPYHSDLVQMLSKSPPLNLEVVEVHYIVLICLELSIALDMSQIHIVRLFDIWVQELVGCNLTEEAVKKKKGRTISALKHNQLKVGEHTCMPVVVRACSIHTPV